MLAGKGWQERVEAAFTFFSMHVGLAAMAVCSVGQRRLAERAGFLRRCSESEAVRGPTSLT